MKRLNTLFLSAALVTLTAAPELRAQTTDAPTTGESITIELTETKDKEINIGAFAPAGNAWIDINGDGVCQDNERLGRNSTRPEDYTDIFYMGPEIETFTLDEKTQMVHIYGEIEAIRFEKSYTQTSPISIDLSKATTPKYIRIYECEELTDVTFPTLEKNNCEVLLIQYTALQELDLSSFEKLKVLVTSFNEQLRSVKQTKCEDMEELDFSFTLIPSVDLSFTPALASLYLCKAQLSEIDLTPTPDLEWLSIGANNLTKIDLSKTPGLTYLSIYDNELKEIDVTPLSNLEILEVEQNKLTKLDLSKNTNLEELTLHLNEITALDLSMLEELHYLSIFENNISEQAMQQVIDKMPRCKTMPEDEGDELWGALYVVNTKSPNGNVCNTLQVAKLKEMGWNAIIYLAAITSIDPELYEAAELDGAGRFQRMWHITIQCIRPTIALLFILAVSGCLSSNFDQVFFLSNSANMSRSETLDLYIYNMGIVSGRFSFSTAVLFFRSIISYALLRLCNFTSVKLTGESII